MEEKKLTDEEIVKALENCVNGEYLTKCKNCYYNNDECGCQGMDIDMLDLIHRLQSKNAETQQQVDELVTPKEASEWVIKAQKAAVKDTAKEIFPKVKERLKHLDNEWEISNALYPLEQEYLNGKGVVVE